MALLGLSSPDLKEYEECYGYIWKYEMCKNTDCFLEALKVYRQFSQELWLFFIFQVNVSK